MIHAMPNMDFSLPKETGSSVWSIKMEAWLSRLNMIISDYMIVIILNWGESMMATCLPTKMEKSELLM